MDESAVQGMTRLRVPKGVAARLARGHCWVFSNEAKFEEAHVEPGSEVLVTGEDGTVIGSAFANRQALVAARLYSHRAERFTAGLLEERLDAAIRLRERLLPGREAVRLVFSESDGLPGLIVDRYGPALTVQFLSAAFEQRRGQVLELLRERLSPAVIAERGDSSGRTMEGLPDRSGLVHGELTEPVVVEINGLRFGVNPAEGQKTGLYLDQAENWRLVETFAPERNVLDLFCNAGGFALHAARAGAASVRAVDTSGEALSQLLFNAERNGLTGRIRTKQTDAFQYVRSRPGEFDVIVCDPPPFARSRKQLAGALRGYRELNRQCMKMLTPGGVLLTFSCSAAVAEGDFDHMLGLSARDAGRRFRVLPGGGQPADHAPLLGMPETHYLKARILQALD